MHSSISRLSHTRHYCTDCSLTFNLNSNKHTENNKRAKQSTTTNNNNEKKNLIKMMVAACRSLLRGKHCHLDDDASLPSAFTQPSPTINALWSISVWIFMTMASDANESRRQISHSLFASFHKWSATSDAKVVQLFSKCIKRDREECQTGVRFVLWVTQ